eukprot:CAMPEP_0204304260 /NCGR_PEP_ID=MMETSP0468-20130131/84323_1 /ASSEMBLY_ACC=CAM_ASM_000383 /TAXON_ID=2969 /ORGANISM="Oxyrrhis marina" /LENGTH=146 /DNA_ID=CAMNT_0051283583 /DNA_START=430 /DNA_END=870 /DNA_ORIENTATION=+
MAGGLADLCLPHFGLMILRPQRRVAGSLVSCLSGRNLAIEAARLYAIVLARRPGCVSRRATPLVMHCSFNTCCSVDMLGRSQHRIQCVSEFVWHMCRGAQRSRLKAAGLNVPSTSGLGFLEANDRQNLWSLRGRRWSTVSKLAVAL